MIQYAFNQEAIDFNPANMEFLAHCANLVYGNADAIGQGLQELGFTPSSQEYYFASELTDTHGFIVGDKEKIILAFAGTEPNKLADWITDSNILKIEFEPQGQRIGFVHTGFYHALLSVWEMVEMRLHKLRDNNQSVWITGHSLGGALATLAAAQLVFSQQSMLIPVNGVYTFGQPRVGDFQFAEIFDTKIGHRCFRIVNNFDIVSRVPARLLGYRHVGRFKYFDLNGEFTDNKSFWDKFWDDPRSYYDDLFNIPINSIADHSMEKYHDLAKRLCHVIGNHIINV